MTFRRQWRRRHKVEAGELVPHTLERVQHLDGLSRVILPEGRLGRILGALLKHGFRLNKGIHTPICV